MKKFLAVFDGYRMSKGTLEYAIRLTGANDAHLVGVFLDEFVYRSYDVYKVISAAADLAGKMNELDALDQQKRDQAVKQFQQACDKAGIHYSVHRDKNMAEQELKHESIFADLVIIGKSETFSRNREKAPTRFVRNLLAASQCPVLVVPQKFRPIDSITILYDGSPSSVYAARMFSYLMGRLENLPIEIFTVKDSSSTLHLPDNKLMREFTKRHFPQASYQVVKGEAESRICGHLRNLEGNELVVLGAYRRSELSRVFKASMADILMRELEQPLLVAHQ